MAPGDRTVGRGMLLVLLAVVAIPALLLMLTTLPQEARAAAFVGGLLAVAALSVTGALSARRGLLVGTSRTARAILTAIVGLTLGVTGAVFAVWSVLGA
jgi:hypothetical protein